MVETVGGWMMAILKVVTLINVLIRMQEGDGYCDDGGDCYGSNANIVQLVNV